jgi:chitodextrinase
MMYCDTVGRGWTGDNTESWGPTDMGTIKTLKAKIAVSLAISLGFAPVFGPMVARADSPPTCTVSPTLVNSCRPWLGGTAFNYAAAAADYKSQILYQEQRQGRQDDIAHTYHPVGSNTLSSLDMYFANRPGTMLFTNWKPTATWGNIATQNAAIDSMANSVKSLGSTKIFMTLYHEPENEVSPGGDPNCPNVTYKGSAGTVADYRNMWAYVENRFAADGVTNVVWAMDYMNYSPWDCLEYDLYPGDNLVNWIVFDSYGTSASPSYNTTVSHFYNLLTTESGDPASNHDFLSKPWGLAEWGETGTTTAQEEAFYDDAKTALDNNTYPKLKMYLIYDSNSQASPTGANLRVGYDDNGTLDPTKGAHYYAFANDPNITGSWQFADGTAPSVPTGLTATATSSSHVSLSWQPATDNVGVTGYNVYRNGTQIATVSTGTTYVDAGLSDTTTYSYTVAALDAAGNVSAPSTAAAATTPDGTAPSVPANLTATAINTGEVDLTWQAATDSSGVTAYQLYRNNAPLVTLGGTVTSYPDLGVSPQTHYTYAVAALDAAGNQSAQSAAASATTSSLPPADTTPPSVPAGLTASAKTGSEIDLNWQGSTDDTGVAGYHIFCNGQALATVPATATSYPDTGLKDATAYSYTVSAYDAAANTSAQSSAASATTPDVTPPSVPTGLTATVAGAAVNLAWNAAVDNVGVSAYEVYRNGLLLQTLSSSAGSYQDSSVEPQTGYTYAIVAIDAAGNSSVQSAAAEVTTPAPPADTTPPSIPTALAAVAVSGGAISLSWQGSTDATGVVGYDVYRNGQPLTTTAGTVTSYTDNTVSDATSYTYTVAAFDAAPNVSAQSAAATATTPDVTAPSVPNGVTATAASDTEIDLSWTAATDNVGVSGYEVYRDGGSLVTLGNVTSYHDTAAAPQTSYSYTVVAVDAAGNPSAPSQAASATTPQAPDLTPPSVPAGLSATTVGGSEIDLKWNTATDNVGVVGYDVYRGGAQIATIPGPGTSYKDTALHDASSYQYTVAAYDAAGNHSAQSNTVGASTTDVTAPNAPSGLVANAQTGHSIQLSWAAATDNVGVSGYHIYRNNIDVGTVTGTSYLDSGLNDATAFIYTVTAIDAANNESAQSPAVTATTPDVTPPSAPANPTATATSGTSVKVSWNASTDNVGVAGYQVYRGASVIATVTAGLTYTDTGLTNSTAYQYTVVGLDAAGNVSTPSAAVTATTLDTTPPSVPTNPTATATSGTSVNVSWTASTDNVGVTGYGVYRTGALVATVSGTTYTDSGLTSAATYQYTIVAYDAGENVSAQSAAASATTPDTVAPSVPTNITATAASGTSVNVAWQPATDNVGVAGYWLYRNGSLVATIKSGTSYTDTGLANVTTYHYTVSAYDTAGNASAASTSASATTPDSTAPSVPTSLTAAAAGTSQVNLSWQAATDNVAVTGYNVYRNGVKLATTASLTYSDTGLTSSTTYQYTVAAVDAAGNSSAQTGTVNATTAAPADTTPPSKPSNFSAISLTYNQITLGWTASTDNVGVTGYHIYRKAVLIATLGKVTSYQDITVAANTSYTYKIEAFDAAGNLSAQATAPTVVTPLAPDTTPPNVPATPKLTHTATAITATWTASTDNVRVTGYTVYRNGVKLGTTASLTYTDSTVKQGTTYGYTIAAFDAAGNNSAQSTAASLLFPDTTAPSTPAGVVATAGTKLVTLTWKACSDNIGVTGYSIYRGSALIATLGGTTVGYTDKGLTTGTTYSYHVIAFDAAGNKSASSAVISTKAK